MMQRGVEDETPSKKRSREICENILGAKDIGHTVVSSNVNVEYYQLSIHVHSFHTWKEPAAPGSRPPYPEPNIT